MSEMQIVDQSLNKEEAKDINKNEPVNTDKENVSRDELKSLLEENLELTKDVRAMVNHINRYVAWQRIFGVLKVLIILVPIILGVIYLPPILKDSYSQIISIMQSSVDTK